MTIDIMSEILYELIANCESIKEVPALLALMSDKSTDDYKGVLRDLLEQNFDTPQLVFWDLETDVWNAFRDIRKGCHFRWTQATRR